MISNSLLAMTNRCRSICSPRKLPRSLDVVELKPEAGGAVDSDKLLRCRKIVDVEAEQLCSIGPEPALHASDWTLPAHVSPERSSRIGDENDRGTNSPSITSPTRPVTSRGILSNPR